MFHSELDFRLSDDSWIEDDLHTLGTLYCTDIFDFFQCLLVYLAVQGHLSSEPVHITVSEGCLNFSQMNTGNLLWDT
jgi:hypothetical protein